MDKVLNRRLLLGVTGGVAAYKEAQLARLLQTNNVEVQSAMSEEARQNNLANRIPLHREGTPEQVASLILQLTENDFITGETMVIDGGMSMRMV